MTRVNNQGVPATAFVGHPAFCAIVRWRRSLAYQCGVRGGWCVVWDVNAYVLRRAPVEGHPAYCLRHARDVMRVSIRADDRVLV